VRTSAKNLFVLAAILVALAVIARAIVPQNLLFPGGWSLGSHWYHADWVPFRVFLIVGFAFGFIVTIYFVLRHEGIR
jgi:hypothetical protein